MKQKKKIIGLFILILISGVATVTACGFLGFGSTEKWKEEVKLSDGRVIVVCREIINEMGGDEWASNRSGLKPKEYIVRFAHPDESGKTIEWRTIKKSPRTYPEIPLILDIYSGHLVMFTLVGVGPGCEVYNKYIYRDGAWIEETLPEKFENRRRNLLVNGKDIPKYVNLEIKRNIDESGHSRREVVQVGPNRKVCD